MSLIEKSKPQAASEEQSEVVRRIVRALAGIDYGSVEITIQDSRVVQIERKQKSRFAQPLKIPSV